MSVTGYDAERWAMPIRNTSKIRRASLMTTSCGAGIETAIGKLAAFVQTPLKV